MSEFTSSPQRDALHFTLHRYARELDAKVPFQVSALDSVLDEWSIRDMATLANLNDGERKSISERVLQATVGSDQQPVRLFGARN